MRLAFIPLSILSLHKWDSRECSCLERSARPASARPYARSLAGGIHPGDLRLAAPSPILTPGARRHRAFLSCRRHGGLEGRVAADRAFYSDFKANICFQTSEEGCED